MPRPELQRWFATLCARFHRGTGRVRGSATEAALFRDVIEQADEAILLVDVATHLILYANPALAHLTGYVDAVLQSRSVQSLLAPAAVPLFLSVLPGSDGGVRQPCEIALQCSDGHSRSVECSIRPLAVGDGPVLCVVFRDLSLRKQAEAHFLQQQRRLEHLAHHDPLTDLPNRLHLSQRLPGLIAQAAREGRALAVCYLDVDNFKNVNDGSGHDVGDEYLRAIAERLRHVVSASDLVARISGDEFVVVSAARDARIFDAIARRITGHLRTPIRIGERDLPASVSMGISVFPNDGADATELLRNADIALYQAKQKGRDTYQFFVPEMNAKVHERMRLEQALRKALAEDRLGIEYQPVIDLRSGRVAALEALARWQHPELGRVPPSQFVPVAEEAGLIVELGERVMRGVCRQLVAWRQAGMPPVPVAVNVSAQQLQRTDIRERVLAICSETGVQPRLLQLELTESALMRDVDRQIAALEGLRAAGVRVSIDDFGTGYSSLSYLKHLPIDHLKIDRSFVRDMAVDANDAAIVSAIISMARSLRLETIAEGVETGQHAMRLASLGCSFAQGGYYSAALPADACQVLLKQIAARGGEAFGAPLPQRWLRR
jgi:diguanylate cyclase (GGDEF)-like protein/PAS domain S-box-containing protein